MNRIPTFEQNRKRLIKKIIAVALLVVIGIVFIFAVRHAINEYKEQKYLETYGQAAMEVGGHTVTYDVYRYFYLNYRDDYIKEYTIDGVTDTDALDAAVRARVIEAIRGLYGTVSLAADYGITTSDGDVIAAAETYIESMKNYYTENGGNYAADLERSYLTEHVFEFLMRIDALEDKLFDALVASDGGIENNDEKVLTVLLGDTFVRAKQIFIENDKGEDVEANRAIAVKALEEYKGGESFDTLIGRYSEDFTMPADGYYFTYAEMIDEFERAAFALRDGEVSDVVESKDGFHIILRMPKDGAYITENFADLKSQYQSATFYSMLESRANMLSAVESSYVRSLSYEEIK
ncbi:MAG: peptidylprolyl isomerase [Clostridia bacterium]|nr:peptidylprolyl isomerase [Clostridia bacterium]